MLSQLLAEMQSKIWAIDQMYLFAVLNRARFVDWADIRAYRLDEEAARPKKAPRVAGNVAVVPLHGPISQRESMFQQLFGGTSADRFSARFSQAINSDRVKGVILDVDSPGGETGGVEQAAEIVRDGSQRKPVVAVANSQMASAAYWIGSAAGRVFAAPSADVGSIGVYRMHMDVSEALEKEGVKVNFLSVPEYKTEANPYEPLSEEGRQHHMEQVNITYDAFNRAVAGHRNVSPSHAKEYFGKGRSFDAKKALTMGLVDGVKSLPQIVNEMTNGNPQAVASAASDLQQKRLLLKERIAGIN